jgi:hypothetical protein
VSKGPWRKTPLVRPAKELVALTKPDPEPLPEAEMTKETKPSDLSPTDALALQMAQFMQLMMESQKDMNSKIAELGNKISENRKEVRAEAPRPQRPKARETGITQVVGRDGEVLTRRAQFAASDPFDLPPDFVAATLAENYSLEWKTEYVYNEGREVYLSRLQRDGGWRPVKNNRLPGVFSGDGEEPVRHDGMILMERPLELTLAARREEQVSAREQLLMRQRNWGVDSKREDYFDPHHPESEKHTLLRSMREVADPSWAPSHTIASDNEF